MTTGRLSVRWDDMAAEMQTEVMERLDIRDLSSLAFTSKNQRSRANRCIEVHMRRCFAEWGLCDMSVRFMPAQTMTCLAGLWVHRLLFPRDERDWGSAPGHGFFPEICG